MQTLPFLPQPVAVAIGSERISYAHGKAGTMESLPAYIARRGNQVVAIGEEARQLGESNSPGVTVTRVTAQGGLSDGALASRFLQTAMTGKGRFGLIPPKIVVACAQQARFAVVKAFEAAGIRTVITLPPAMAAALGAGLPVSEATLTFSFLLDRDWCSFMAISQNLSVASFEVPGGINQLLEDFAVQTLSEGGPAVGLDSLHQAFVARGVASATAAIDPGIRPFAGRLERRYRLALQKVAPTQVAAAAQAPIHLFGPYAQTPGVADLVSLAFARAVATPPDAESAVLRGVQWVIGDLANLTKPKSRRKTRVG